MQTISAPAASIERDELPVAALLALAMTGFTAILTETLPAGLLPQMADGLGVSASSAGQTVTVYATGSLLAAIPLTAATEGWRRRPTLLSAIAGFLVFNTATAVSSDLTVTLVARFLAGIAAGLVWGMLAGFARRMVTAPLKGKALAVAMVGTPMALSLGVPAGTLLGSAIGWRTAFLAMSGLTVVLMFWVLWAVPDFPGRAAKERRSLLAVFTTPGIRPILATIFTWMTAHNILYTYIAPFARVSGLGRHVDLLLLAFGVAALAGIAVTGLLVDRMLRHLVLASLICFGLVAVGFGLAGTSPAFVTAGVILWGLSFGGAATQLQTASGDASGTGVDLANAMVTTVWNAAIAAGGIVGGLLLGHVGAPALPWAAAVLVLAALLIAIRSHRYGFRPGPRAHT